MVDVNGGGNPELHVYLHQRFVEAVLQGQKMLTRDFFIGRPFPLIDN